MRSLRLLAWLLTLVISALVACQRVVKVIRTQLLWALTSQHNKLDWTAKIYRRQAHPQHIFAWEQSLLNHAKVPTKGRLLLGGCGRGRELVLLARRFDVMAFDPALSPSSSTLPMLSDGFVNADYQSFWRDHLPNCQPFDLLWCGWGSFSHVLDRSERTRLLSQFRQHSPQAVVIISVVQASPWGRLEAFTAQLMQGLLFWAPQHAGSGDHFVPSCGFIHAFGAVELQALLEDAGYQVALASEPYVHALCTPT